MKDERITRAAELFNEAWMLLNNLEDLERRLPPPDMPTTGGLPPDWNEFRSYAVCVAILRGQLQFGFQQVMMGLDFRREFEIRQTLLPPQFRLPGNLWLERLDEEEWGGEGTQPP
jgi:hypothetical protein